MFQLVYISHQALITLRDGTAVRGKLAWSWARGFVRLIDAETLDGPEPEPVRGSVFVPRSSIVVMQVI